jgi:hypothetical protein
MVSFMVNKLGKFRRFVNHERHAWARIGGTAGAMGALLADGRLCGRVGDQNGHIGSLLTSFVSAPATQATNPVRRHPLSRG